MSSSMHFRVEELKKIREGGRAVLLRLAVFCVTGVLAFAARPLGWPAVSSEGARAAIRLDPVDVKCGSRTVHYIYM